MSACSGFTWRVSDCEELVGGYSQEMMEVGFLGIKYSSKVGLLSEFNHQDKLSIFHLTKEQESKSFFYSSASISFSH